MKLEIPSYPSTLFTWHQRYGVAECNDLNGGPRIHGRVYDDTCDVGFNVVSSKTGKVMLFLFEKDVRGEDMDAELISTEYISECGKYRISLLND